MILLASTGLFNTSKTFKPSLASDGGFFVSKYPC